MRVGVYYTNKDVRVASRVVPDIGPGELLLRVEASGICGSDVMEWYRVPKAPVILGHEIAGDIIAVGEGVGYQVGQRIAVFHHVPCNDCHYCLSGHHTVCDTFRSTHFDPGGFAEFVRVRTPNVARGIYPLPDQIDYEEGAFVEPLACIVRGVRTAQLRPEQTLLVIGSGIAGLLLVHLARTLGATKIVATDVVPYRLEMAGKCGADVVREATGDVAGAVREVNGGRLADVVALCTGAPAALCQAWQCAERGATILLFAPPSPDADVPVPLNDLWTNEISVASCYSGSPADARTAADMIFNRRVNVRQLITHRLGLDEIGEGFRLVAEARESVKVMIEPQR